MHIAPVARPASNTMSTGAEPRTLRPVAARGFWPVWLDTVLARRAERQQLLALGERDLRDIGLTSADAWALARKPLWRG